MTSPLARSKQIIGAHF